MGGNGHIEQTQWRMVRRMDMTLLLVHITLLIFFFCTRIMIAAYFNIFSVSWYTVLFFLEHKKRISVPTATWLIISEVWAQVIVAVYCIGWNAEFQLFCIGIVSILFFAAYHVGNKEAHRFHPVPASIISMTIYFSLRAWTLHRDPYYAAPTVIISLFSFLNPLLIFLLVIVFSQQYANMIHSAELVILNEANYDELTKLYNRRKMREILGKVQDMTQKSDIRYCITMMDIDDFKKVNDTYGHAAGDYVLIIIGQILVAHTCDCARVCRWGGEEFLMAETYTNSPDACVARIESIRKEIESYQFNFNNVQFKVTITAGVAYSETGVSIARLIAAADDNLYIGKGSGKNRVVR